MPQSITQQAMRRASKAVAAALGGEFRRQGPHLHRWSTDVFHCIHFQASQWGSADSGRFTINLVVTASYLFEPWLGMPFPANPATALFPIQQRIGVVMPSHTDHWWQVDRSTDLDAIAAESVFAMTQYGLPFFAEWSDARAILDRLRSPSAGAGARLTEALGLIVRAMAAVHLGDRDDAKHAIDAALVVDPSASTRLLALAAALSL